MRLHFGRATRIMGQTLPFVLLRIGIAVGIGLLAVVYFGAIAGIAWYLGGSLSTLILLAVFAVSLIGFLFIVNFLRKYVLYLVSAGHIATIAHIIDTGDVPDNQLAFGKNKVTDRFVEASALFAVDKVIKSVLKQFNSAVISLSSLVNFVPALQNIIKVLRKAITLAGRNLDEAILAHMFIAEDKDNWTAARDGLVLYAKTWKPVLTTTVLIVLAAYVVSAVGAIIVSPLAVVFESASPVGEAAGWAIVLGIVAVGYYGFVSPWIKTVVITTFLIEAQDETPDSETMDFLESKASDFREVVENAGQDIPAGDEAPTGAGDDAAATD